MHFDETDIMIEAYAGESFDINTVYNSGNQTIGIWVDWDDNGIFGDDDERIFLNYGSSPQSTEILIPENIEAGNYRMRVRGSWGNHVSDGDGFACNEKQYGNSVDFTLTVLEGDEPIADCEAPEDLEIDDITENSAFVIWEPGMDPEDSNGWEVVYGPEGFDIDGDQGTSIIVEDAPFVELEDLDADTAYDVFVRTICEDDLYSDWVSESFTTGEEDEPVGECTWTVEISSSGYGDFITWTLKDEDGNILLSGGEYTGIGFNDIQSVNHEGPVTFEISDWGFFGDNEADFSVSNDNGVIISGEVNSSPQTFSSLTCTDEPLEDCTGTPDAGTVVIAQDSGQTGSVVEFSVSGYSTDLGLSYDWEYSTDDGDTWTSTGVSTPTANFQITGDQGTIFQVRFVVTCTNSDETSYSNIVSFTIDNVDCTPTYTSSLDHLSSVSTDGAQTDINYSISSSDGGMHFDETDIMIEAYAGESFDINTVYNSGNQTIGIWVDWDDNGVFGDDDERIFLNYGSSPQSTEILIPENIEAGNYRMRVRGSW